MINTQHTESLNWQELDTVKGKILLVGDLHLNTKEMTSTKKMIKNNIVMLKNLYDYLVQNEDVVLVIFLGDIQHKTPSAKNSVREIYRWNSWFKKIGRLMATRYFENEVTVNRIANTKEDDESITVNEHGLEIPSISDFNEAVRTHEILPLFTLRGNHDIDTERVNGLQVDENADYIPYTYYDLCISEGLLINPEQLIINNELLINFYNYGEAQKQYSKPDGIKHVIGLYHDTIITEDTPFWMRDSGKAYSPTEAIQFEDSVYIGHIHEKYEPVFIEADGREVPVTIVGSMGRTSTGEGQIRDVGFCQSINTEDLDEFNSVEIPVIPANEYFNLREKIARKETERQMQEFTLSMGDEEHELTELVDARTLIGRLQIDNEIKSTCIDLIEEVTNK